MYARATQRLFIAACRVVAHYPVSVTLKVHSLIQQRVHIVCFVLSSEICCCLVRDECIVSILLLPQTPHQHVQLMNFTRVSGVFCPCVRHRNCICLNVHAIYSQRALRSSGAVMQYLFQPCFVRGCLQ